MSDNVFEVIAEPRSDMGKGASRRLRRDGKLPAIVYGANKDPEMVAVGQLDLQKSLQNETFYSHILDLKMGGKVDKVILKDLQRHPHKPILLHADFQRISAETEITIHIPLHFLNEETCVGVKRDGGRIAHQLSNVEVTCLPKDLPEFIEVDVADLGMGEGLTLSNLTVPAGVGLTDLAAGQDLPVVSVESKAELVEEEGEAEEGITEEAEQEREPED